MFLTDQVTDYARWFLVKMGGYGNVQIATCTLLSGRQ